MMNFTKKIINNKKPNYFDLKYDIPLRKFKKKIDENLLKIIFVTNI
jgi:hypothetical protein